MPASARRWKRNEASCQNADEFHEMNTLTNEEFNLQNSVQPDLSKDRLLGSVVNSIYLVAEFTTLELIAYPSERTPEGCKHVCKRQRKHRNTT